MRQLTKIAESSPYSITTGYTSFLPPHALTRKQHLEVAGIKPASASQTDALSTTPRPLGQASKITQKYNFSFYLKSWNLKPKYNPKYVNFIKFYGTLNFMMTFYHF